MTLQILFGVRNIKVSHDLFFDWSFNGFNDLKPGKSVCNMCCFLYAILKNKQLILDKHQR